MTEAQQRSKVDYLGQLNRRFAAQHPEQSELEARIAGYELAFRMQTEAPEAVDVTQETEATRRLYGIEANETRTFGRMC